MAKSVWVVAEVRDGAVKRVTYECLTKAKELAQGGSVGAVLVGPPALAGELGAYGAQKVYNVEDPKLANYSGEAYAKAVADLAKQHNPDVILAGATPFGRDLMPRVAMKLNAGLATDCVEAGWQGDAFTALRPVYAGKARTKISFDSKPAVATLRPNAFPAQKAGGIAQVEKVAASVDGTALRAQVKETVKTATGGTVELTEASIIVTGGRGIKGPENYPLVEALAKELGAACGASRAVVDAGWKPHSFQVGQTGKTVAPNIYIAAGVSGAIQHLAGMSSSKCIVAINKDPNAPIFKVADYGVVCDLFQILPALTEEVKKQKGGK
jgi:electron transfer flavoprotein alpha subunit